MIYLYHPDCEDYVAAAFDNIKSLRKFFNSSRHAAEFMTFEDFMMCGLIETVDANAAYNSNSGRWEHY